ncbi:MAG: transcription termination/antitermination factor NusG [Planctomycetaceae bacterium]|nr:transcription termination/antitermination factor NusG [Planctomycetaceae bacterium]
MEDEPISEEEAISDDENDEDEDDDADVEPLEFIQEEEISDEDIETKWYILKVQVNREDSIRDALERRVKIEGLERYFRDIVVPTEDIAEFTKTGKRRIVKKKLYPGYIMVNMAINDDTWFIVRETPGIGDFTGSAGRPAPMDPADVGRILKLGADEDDEEQQIKTAIPFKIGDRVRVKEGYFQNFEGDVDVVDEANGRVTVMINIFGRSTPVELEHWQIEAV